MVIIETHTFSKRIKRLMDDDVYRELQNELIESPDAGKIILSDLTKDQLSALKKAVELEFGNG